MKIFIASLSTETNTFAAIPTGLGAYHIDRGGIDESNPWNVVIEEVAEKSNAEVVVGIQAFAQPNGLTVQAVYESLRDELLGELEAAMPVDAVILPLHGAMVAEGYPDCEGDIVERVRGLVGPDVPIGVELDPHCHFTAKMNAHADIIIAYKEYPHTDAIERFYELWDLTIKMVNGEIEPVTEAFDCHMIDFWHTTREPMKSFVKKMQDLEGTNGILSVSFGHGFPYGDVAEAGAKVWVLADRDRDIARQTARDLGRELWQMRGQTHDIPLSLDNGIQRLKEHAVSFTKPLIIADSADNPGGGASSDSTFILKAIVDSGIGNVALGAFWDAGAIQMCKEAGVGARLALRVGGKCGPASGDPVDLQVEVRAIDDEHAQSALGTIASPCGPSVWVSTDDGIDIVFISIRQQVFGVDMFTGLGIDLANKSAVVVKSSQHFRAEFDPIADDVIYVETPGLLRMDFENLPYKYRNLNYWPRVDDPWAGNDFQGGGDA